MSVNSLKTFCILLFLDLTYKLSHSSLYVSWAPPPVTSCLAILAFLEVVKAQVHLSITPLKF